MITPPEYLTVKTLREYLDKLEATWTDEDVDYLGEFENHKINTVHYDDDGKCLGIGMSTIYYHGGLDFVIIPSDWRIKEK